MPPSPDRTPPFVPWPTWRAQQWARTRQGQHILFSGPTQSGKTLLCRKVTEFHSYTVVFGTKAVDPTLDAYVADGYTRIDHWPVNKADLRDQPPGQARFILWPKMKSRDDLRRYRKVYARALEDIFIEGNWCVVVDEGLWMSSRKGLDLGQEIADVAYGAASNKVSLHLLVQRPSNVPPVAWTSCSLAMLFHSGRTDDIRELASLGTYTPREAQTAIRNLQGHRFLCLPCRGGMEWSESEVELAR